MSIYTNFPAWSKEKFWMDNYHELYQNNNFTKFYPTYEMTRNEQLNALTRFSIYLAVLLLVFDKNQKWIYLPITFIVLIVLFHNINKLDSTGKEKELHKLLNVRQKIYDKEKAIMKAELKHDGKENYSVDYDTESEDTKSYDLEAGYYDADGNLRVGQKVGLPKYQRDKPDGLYTIDELLEFKKNTCRKPSVDNPYMNPRITDYNTFDPPAACNAYDDDIKDDTTVNFNHNLFRDVDELWERHNSQRQFYTIPNTAIPNNQTEFANWLYKVPNATCKENGEKCLRYEDLRFTREDIVS